MAVIHILIPIEIVVGLAQAITFGRISFEIEPWQPTTDARPIARFLEIFRHRTHAIRKLDAVLPT
ncbi:MAG: hypothetical protein ACJ07L_07040, partial [Opitutales bacterium]